MQQQHIAIEAVQEIAVEAQTYTDIAQTDTIATANRLGHGSAEARLNEAACVALHRLLIDCSRRAAAAARTAAQAALGGAAAGLGGTTAAAATAQGAWAEPSRRLRRLRRQRRLHLSGPRRGGGRAGVGGFPPLEAAAHLALDDRDELGNGGLRLLVERHERHLEEHPVE